MQRKIMRNGERITENILGNIKRGGEKRIQRKLKQSIKDTIVKRKPKEEKENGVGRTQ